MLYLISLLVLMYSGSGPPISVNQSANSDALDVIGEIVRTKYETLRLPEARKCEGNPCPLLVDVQSVIAAVRETTGQEVSPEKVEAAIEPEFRAVTKEQALRCAPWEEDPRKEECWVVDNGSHLSIKSLTRTPLGWKVVVDNYFTGEDRLPGQSQIQWNQFGYTYEKQNGEWVQTEKQLLGRS